MRYIRQFVARFGLSLQALALVFLALAAQEGLAGEARAQIPIIKILCAGTPVVQFDPLNDSANCASAQIVPVGSPVFYVFKVTNPLGAAPRIVSLADAFPGFTLSGPVTCRDPAGMLVALAGTSVPNGIGEFALGSNATVICFAPGQFATAGSKSNMAIVKDKETNVQGSSGFNVLVVAPSPLNTDLQLVKTETSGPADVSTGVPAILEYEIKIHNSGPMVDVGNLFVLHDNLRLLPNSVPLRASLISWSCAPSVASTMCLNAAGPVLTTTPPALIGSMAPVPIFSWGFAPGLPGNGRIDAGATITVKFKIKVERLPAWTCVKQLNADGLRNTAFFTLTNATTGTAMTELNAANNTAIADKSVLTGTNVVQGCGQGQLSITKTLVMQPPPPLGFPWTLPWIEYEIEVKNVSMPAQPIAIQGGKLQDWVAVGVNTPLPWRATPPASTICTTPGTCGGSFSVTPTPPFHYSFYTQSAKAWQSSSLSGFTLAPGATAKFRTRLRYYGPACDTVPNADPKLMWNIAMVDYMATPVGMAGPLQAYHAEASAPAPMKKQAPCPFVVKKRLVSAPAKVTFGSILHYEVKYSNFGLLPETVGTVMDSVRITDPGYALSLPFSSNWSCSGAAVGNLNASGSLVGGSALHTTSPAHGSPAIRLHANPALPLVFPAGSTLTCQVHITVLRPAFDGPFCTANPVQWENFGLMEKALPYNPNPIFWPPGVSGLYVPASGSNPSPQINNWASVRIPLPRCFGAIINKEATVDGLPPTSAPWIYTTPPAPDIHYAVKVTNTAQSNLTGSGTVLTTFWNGLMVVDALGLPYTAGGLQLDPPTCAGNWCTPGVNSSVGVGVASLPPLQSGVWKFKYPGTGFSTGKNMVNCARVVASGIFMTPDWYPHYNPAAAAPSPANTMIANPQHSCITIPIFETAKVQVTKITRGPLPLGAPLANAGPFPIQLTCGPYFIPNSSSTGTVATTLSTGPSGSSQPWVVSKVPVAANETCQVSEGNPANVPVPQPPVPLCPPGQTAKWGPPAIVPAGFSPVAGVNQVSVTNQVICVAPVPTRELRVTKIVNFLGLPPPSGTFTIQLNCSGGGAIPPSVTLSHNTSATVQVPVNATCTPTETSLPALPVIPGLICSWNPPFFQPPVPLTISPSGPNFVMVINSPACVKQP